MVGRRTCATSLPLPLEVLADLLTNLRFNRELRNLQSEFTPPPVILDAIPENSSRTTYDIRRQFSPSTSPEASLQHYLNYPQAMVNTPEGTVFHTTSIPMGQGVMAEPTRPMASRPVFPPTTDRYTQPTVAFQTTSNPPSPRRTWDEHASLPDRPSSASD